MSDIIEVKTLPVIIKIATPSYIAIARGIESTAGPDGERLQFRCLKAEKDTIALAAEMLGISPSNFVRWVAYYAATALLKPTADNAEYL